MIYLHKFATEQDFNSVYYGNGYVEPWVSLTQAIDRVDYNKRPYEYVDLGLPSGTLWSTKNLGASSPEDYGDYYAWGELAPKSAYTVENYRFYDENSETPTRIFSKYNYTDAKIILDPEDDAANVIIGNDWNIPTYPQFEELIDYDNTSWDCDAVLNGVSGCLFTSKINGNTLFVPYAGGINRYGSFGQGENFLLWGNQLEYDDCAIALVNGESPYIQDDGTFRYFGYSIRPVLRVQGPLG